MTLKASTPVIIMGHGRQRVEDEPKHYEDVH
jgi:hypothetical protein